ncbi:MAG: lamin tail domain-containing protein, partial [Usitatibacter sp.]
MSATASASSFAGMMPMMGPKLSSRIDAVTYPADATGGASWSLDPAHTDATQNDDKANWCRATTAYGTGGKGTPGADNDSCNVVVPGMCTDSGTGSMRAVVAPAAGDIVINEAMPDPAKVTDAAGEWFELKINRAVDLNGLQLGKDAASATELKSAQCLAVTAGSYALFAHSTDAATNGGLPALPASQTFTFGMSNAPGSLYVGYGGAQLDTMSWTTSTQGKSIQRDPADATKVCSAAAQYN